VIHRDIKPHNLLQHVHVKVQGVESQPELNGLKAMYHREKLYIII
jgi:serine/threonine protein kinase